MGGVDDNEDGNDDDDDDEVGDNSEDDDNVELTTVMNVDTRSDCDHTPLASWQPKS